MRNSLTAFQALRDPPELQTLIRQMNLSRGTFLAVLLLALQIGNLFSRFGTDRLSIRISILLLIALSVLYLLGAALFRPRILERPCLARGWVFAFWGLLILCATPFIAQDIRESAHAAVAEPLNAALLSMLLAVVPIFSRRELLVMYGIFLANNILLCFCLNASIQYILMMAGLVAACIYFSIFIQHGYIRMVWQYKMDSCQDTLTGILNRKGGLERMQVVLALARRHSQLVAVYMVDIDHFKEYNDTMGHIQGDAALTLVAQALLRVFARDSDVVFRFGGEEFVICAAIATPMDTVAMGQRLVDAVRALKVPHPHSSEAPYLSVSVGSIHYAPRSSAVPLTAEELIAQADHAMYRAKGTGGNRSLDQDIVAP